MMRTVKDDRGDSYPSEKGWQGWQDDVAVATVTRFSSPPARQLIAHDETGILRISQMRPSV